ncbi:MAG: hypothetical protein RI922_470 [Bacteroidota bacterium]|jgi:hypothetical protein
MLKRLLFVCFLVLLNACSVHRSFKLIKTEPTWHDLTIHENSSATDLKGNQLEVTEPSINEQMESIRLEPKKTVIIEMHELVSTQKDKAIQQVKNTNQKINTFIHQKKIQSSDNFWLDLIRDFFLFLLIGMIVIGLIAAMIVYGNPVVQTIGKVLATIIIVIGFFALLFS